MTLNHLIQPPETVAPVDFGLDEQSILNIVKVLSIRTLIGTFTKFDLRVS